MEEWLNQLLNSNQLPIITAFVLGLLTAISPCPMATNITAIGYISKDIKSSHRIFLNGILYTLGRVISYTLLGVVLIHLIHKGSSIFHIQKNIAHYGELVVGPALILIGLFMLFAHKIKFPSFGVQNDGKKLAKKGGYGALLIGMLFALAFCPTSGFFYFGTLIPLSAKVTGGIFLPIIFAIATALPVAIIAWILAYSVKNIGKFYQKMKMVERIMRYSVACLFIIIGLYTTWEILL